MMVISLLVKNPVFLFIRYCRDAFDVSAVQSPWRIVQKFLPFFLILLLPVPAYPGNSITEESFSDIMQTRLSSPDLTVAGEKLIGARFIEQIYWIDDFFPLWNAAAVAELLQEIETVELDGLDKKDYLLPGMAELETRCWPDDFDVRSRVELELAMTESILRLAYHLRFGKVNPASLDANWNYRKRLDMDDPVLLLGKAIKTGKVNQVLNRQRVSHPYYLELRRVLAKYLQITASGGWDEIPPEKTLGPGDRDPRIARIRRRLAITGDFPEQALPTESPQLFDEELRQAVIEFQRRHSLEMDGRVGRRTLQAMNVPVQKRIDQIRVNLERLRWIMHELGEDYLLVDIPGFRAFLVQDGRRIWESKIQVGKAFTQTPVFEDEIEYIEFNPTWTIPPGIIKRVILPQLRKDPDYLQKKGYLLLDFQGREIDPRTIDWQNLKGFPYMVRQPAGPDNALGRVKFIFPNPHFVFLHDTNHRNLFNRQTRTFSAGCIRTTKPFRLAELLLVENPGWDRKKIDRVIASKTTTRVFLKKRVPILITYTTVGIDAAGQAIFKPDVYHRDAAVLAALEGPITIDPDVQEILRDFAEKRQEKTNDRL